MQNLEMAVSCTAPMKMARVFGTARGTHLRATLQSADQAERLPRWARGSGLRRRRRPLLMALLPGHLERVGGWANAILRRSAEEAALLGCACHDILRKCVGMALARHCECILVACHYREQQHGGLWRSYRNRGPFSSCQSRDGWNED